ncbi:hypothetical protein V6N11_003640 [Hibiscus sabdariffa]|uniref:Cyclin-like domain-containing protein n=1 Tax=Hibiscus sabdariffa TaxID=183260 RepID=A0ABR2SEA2_9ROSI
MLSKTECDASLYGFVCSENETILKEKEESVDDKYIADYDEECLQMLFDREMRFGRNESESLVLSNHLKHARLEAITWILKARATFGFRFQTAYLSMIYFDRFLSRNSIDSEKSWAIHLLSVVCVSLAAKMEEIQVPALSEFQIEGYNFSKLCKASPPDHFISSIVHIILFTTKEIIVMEHRPSVVAAAAILRALNQRLTRKELDRRMNSVSFCGFLEIEDVYTCYNLMQKVEMGILNMPKTVNLPDSLPTRAIDALDDSSSSGAVCTKRKKKKRLTV